MERTVSEQNHEIKMLKERETILIERINRLELQREFVDSDLRNEESVLGTFSYESPSRRSSSSVEDLRGLYCRSYKLLFLLGIYNFINARLGS